MLFRRAFATLALSLSLAGIFLPVGQAAEIHPSEYERIRDRIKQSGSAPVSVLLLNALSIPDADARAAELQVRIDRLLTELGSEALPGGRLVNSLGILTVWVTEPGLEIVRNSTVASRALFLNEWRHGSLLPQSDGHLDELDRRLKASASGWVDVEATLAVPGAEFDIDRHTGEGSVVLISPAQHSAAVDAAMLLFRRLGVPTSSGLPASTAGGVITVLDVSGVTRNGTVLLRTNERGLAELAWNNWAIALKAPGYRPMLAPLVLPQGYATQPEPGAGQSRAVVFLKTPVEDWGVALATRKSTYRRVLEDVLAPYAVSGTPQWEESFGRATVVLPDAELERLAQARDLRVKYVVIEKPINKPTAPR
jgi:hypothetical protein